MTIQLTRRERILHRVVIGSYVAIWPAQVTAIWLFRGQPELLSRWLEFTRYFAGAYLGLQLVALAFVIRRRRSGIVPTILMFIGGVALIGFLIFPRMWLLLLGIGMSIASGVWVVWPQIRDLFLWMAGSYREIAKSSKM